MSNVCSWAQACPIDHGGTGSHPHRATPHDSKYPGLTTPGASEKMLKFKAPKDPICDPLVKAFTEDPHPTCATNIKPAK